MIEELIKGIREAYIEATDLRSSGVNEDNVNLTIRSIINKHAGLVIGDKIVYNPSNRPRVMYLAKENGPVVPKRIRGIVTKMNVCMDTKDLSISKERANVNTNITFGVFQLGVFVPEDNMGYIVNIDEFNTYDDDIDFDYSDD